MVAKNPSRRLPFNLHPVGLDPDDCGLTKNPDSVLLEPPQEQPSLEYGLQLAAQFLRRTGMDQGDFLFLATGQEFRGLAGHPALSVHDDPAPGELSPAGEN